jgi:3-deoxy-D-manno-octulosonate 8-phosphate phosphatase (KDO 8-P phosphatase)
MSTRLHQPSLEYYAPEAEVLARARQIRLLVLDVDGVLTDGQLYFTEHGETTKAFNTLDGQGIKLLQEQGIEVAIVSGRKSAALGLRASALGITRIAQGREDKFAALQELLAGQPLALEQIACVGDDLPDLLIMNRVGLAFTVPNGHQAAHRAAHACTVRSGGQGAVRDACDFLLQAQGCYHAALARFTGAAD